MQILLFSSLYPNSSNPQHGIFVEQRLKKLLEFAGDIKVVVISPVPLNLIGGCKKNRYKKIVQHEIYNDVEVFRPIFFTLPIIGRYINPISMFLTSINLLRRIKSSIDKPDLIDAHYYFPDGIAALLLGKIIKAPVVITARGSDINYFPKYFTARRYIQWAIQQSAATITVSNALRNRVLEVGGPACKVTTLHNGVDLNIFDIKDKISAKEKIHINSKLLLTVGNLVKEKRHNLIIMALCYLPEYTLAVVGEGPLENSLKLTAIKHNVQDRVIFLGRKSQQELVEYYNAADCSVLASSREGLPNVLLESLACGTPLVASQIGGVPEIMQSEVAGYMFSGEDPKTIAALVMKIDGKKINRQAVRALSEYFSWDNASQGQYKIFKRVIGRYYANKHNNV